ncbi:MAG: hypothetical protein H0Z39_03345 [Peptococcaceae bacterium]|nr:hypothetical protein [Peptococcaceae bacterium]
MRKGLLLVVALLAMSCLLAAAAYTSATVTNYSQIAVVNSSTALLALDDANNAQTGFEDCTAYDDSDMLKFRFGWNNNQQYGLQRDSVYEWYDEKTAGDATDDLGLFTITNNSADDVKVTISENNATSGVTFSFRQNVDNDVTGWQQDTIQFSLEAGTTAQVGVKIQVADDATLESPNFDITVSAVAE